MAEDMEKALVDIGDAYEAFNRGDFDTVARYLHPDLTFHRVAEFERPIEGRDAMRAHLEPDIFSKEHNDVREKVVAGDCVLCRAVFTGKGSMSGIETSVEAWHMWRIKDGLAVEFRYFHTLEEAKAAATE